MAINFFGKNAFSFNTLDQVFDIKQGKFVPPEQITTTIEEIVVDEHAELVVGLDEKKIDLRLLNDAGVQEAKSGFLVEVYLSESDGLKKMSPKDTLDPITGNVVKTGYENYFILEVDK
jgi:hypothetical protein